MEKSLAAHVLEDAQKRFRESKTLAERAMEQVSDEQFFTVLSGESNSIALVVKHMAGNMRSRWTDFLTTDGEKSDRNRDTEFIAMDTDMRPNLMVRWENGWRLVFDAIESLGEDDLLKTVMIRNEPHTVLEAINRQLTHYAYHAGQIVFLAKYFNDAAWKTLSVARGQSGVFNAKKMGV